MNSSFQLLQIHIEISVNVINSQNLLDDPKGEDKSSDIIPKLNSSYE